MDQVFDKTSPRVQQGSRGLAIKGERRVSLTDLINSGLLPADAVLEMQADDKKYIGRIHGGKIEVNGQVYSTPSSASCQLRQVRSWNGWIDWRFNGETIAQIRQRYNQANKPTNDSSR
jgi:sulfate adenylyltransferase subunit 1 (EFTu-like GTPase family)